MYNRYIPQPDGSYRKNRMPEPQQRVRPPQTPPRQEHTCRPGKEPVSCPPPVPCPAPPPKHEPPKCPRRQPQNSNETESLTGFFRQLLPQNIEPADLLIVLLLLLMAGDCEEDRNNALLTLALYFFL